MLPEGDSDVTSVQPERELATSQPANASLLEETAVFISRYYSKLFSTAQNIFSAPGHPYLAGREHSQVWDEGHIGPLKWT